MIKSPRYRTYKGPSRRSRGPGSHPRRLGSRDPGSHRDQLGWGGAHRDERVEHELLVRTERLALAPHHRAQEPQALHPPARVGPAAAHPPACMLVARVGPAASRRTPGRANTRLGPYGNMFALFCCAMYSITHWSSCPTKPHTPRRPPPTRCSPARLHIKQYIIRTLCI